MTELLAIRPLLAEPRPPAVLDDALLDEARRRYHDHFNVAADSRG